MGTVLEKRMEPELTTNPEALDSEEARAKAFISAECENSVAAGVTFVAVRFDGYGDSIVTKEVGCF